MTADCIFQANKLAVLPPLVPHTTLQMMMGNPEVFQQLWSVDVPQDKMMANRMAGFSFLYYSVVFSVCQAMYHT